MNPQQKKVIVLVLILVVVPIVLWWRLSGGPAPDTAPLTENNAGENGSTSAAEGVKSQFEEDIEIEDLLRQVQEVEFNYAMVSEDARNPMTPRVGRPWEALGTDGNNVIIERAPRRVDVTAIIWTENNPQAVVDDEVVAAGSELPSGMVIEAINPDHVVIKDGDLSFPVYMKEQ